MSPRRRQSAKAVQIQTVVLSGRHRLTARQERAVVALLEQPTLRAAAGAAGVSERTLRRWLADDVGFQAAYRAARTQVLQQATGRLQTAATEAVDTLRGLLRSEEKAEVRCKAALGILSSAATFERLENLGARIEALEAALAGGAAKAGQARPSLGVRS